MKIKTNLNYVDYVSYLESIVSSLETELSNIESILNSTKTYYGVITDEWYQLYNQYILSNRHAIADELMKKYIKPSFFQKLFNRYPLSEKLKELDNKSINDFLWGAVGYVSPFNFKYQWWLKFYSEDSIKLMELKSDAAIEVKATITDLSEQHKSLRESLDTYKSLLGKLNLTPMAETVELSFDA